MADVLNLVTAAITLAAHSDVIREAVSSVFEKWIPSSPVTETDGELNLEGPDKRVSFGIAKKNGKYALALIVEREDSWVLRKVKEIEESSSSSNLVVKVTGKVHSSRPNDKIPTEPQKKLNPGVSIGHYRGYPGTLGCLVEIKTDTTNWPGIIGAAHVLSINNTAKKGEDIIHPGWPDGSRSLKNRIGELDNYTYLVHYQNDDSDPLNTEDVAVVRPDDVNRLPVANLVPNPKDPDRRITLKGCIPADQIYERVGEEVYKVGRTSGFTIGTLEIASTKRFALQLPNGRIYFYDNLAAVKSIGRGEFSRPGDSGSIVYTKDGLGIGLIVGGSPEYSFLSPLSICLAAVNADLLV